VTKLLTARSSSPLNFSKTSRHAWWLRYCNASFLNRWVTPLVIPEDSINGLSSESTANALLKASPWSIEINPLSSMMGVWVE